jgi:hypothetical protein
VEAKASVEAKGNAVRASEGSNPSHLIWTADRLSIRLFMSGWRGGAELVDQGAKHYLTARPTIHQEV